MKTRSGIWQVGYNGENRPVSWTCGATNLVMKFDHMGRRVEYVETVVNPVDSTIATNKHQRFVYDKYLCIQRLNGTNNAVTDLFEWDPTESVATRPLYWQPRTADGDFSLFYTHDGNKNVSEAVHYQRARGVAAHYEYAPFGEVTAQTRGNAWGTLDLATDNPWRFSSEYADDASATVYYNYRHYEPVMGRWTSRDPLDLTPIFYLFCLNNPADLLDRYGTTEISMNTTIKEMNSPRGFLQFISVEVKVVEPPESGCFISFIQLKRSGNQDWSLDIKGTLGPYYYSDIELSRMTRTDKNGAQFITLYDAPGGAIYEKVEFFSAVVEVCRKCRLRKAPRVYGLKQFPGDRVQCIDKIQVLASQSWTFNPEVTGSYVFVPQADSRALTYSMVPVLRNLVQSRTWRNLICDDVKVVVE